MTTTATIALVGSLAGVVLGSVLSFLVQYLLANRTRKWELEDTERESYAIFLRKLEDTKRESYAEFLTSISTSYAKAEAGKGDPEDADLLRATAIIELIAGSKIAKQTRLLQKQVTAVHKEIRKGGSAAEQAKKTGVPEADRARHELITLLQADLNIPPDGDNGQAAGRAEASGQAGMDQPSEPRQSP